MNKKIIENKEEKIGKNIQTYRMAKNWTQDELASAVYSTKSTISKWENGQIVPSIPVLKIIAKALGVSLFKLLGEKTPISSRIVNIIGRMFLYCFVWVHIDITFAGLLIAISLGIALGGAFAGIGGFVTYMVSAGLNGASMWPMLVGFGYLISAPLLFTIFFGVAWSIYIVGRTVLVFSLKYFWRWQKARYKPFELNWISKVERKYWIMFWASIVISVIYILIVVILLSITKNWHSIENINF